MSDFVYLPIDMEEYIEGALSYRKGKDLDWKILDQNCSWKELKDLTKNKEGKVKYCEIDKNGRQNNWNKFKIDNVKQYLEWRYLEDELDSVMSLEGRYGDEKDCFHAVFGYDTDDIEEVEELGFDSPRVVVTLLKHSNNSISELFTGSEHPSSHLKDLK